MGGRVPGERGRVSVRVSCFESYVNVYRHVQVCVSVLFLCLSVRLSVCQPVFSFDALVGQF